jgi:hypothetical protein
MMTTAGATFSKMCEKPSFNCCKKFREESGGFSSPAAAAKGAAASERAMAQQGAVNFAGFISRMLALTWLSVDSFKQAGEEKSGGLL